MPIEKGVETDPTFDPGADKGVATGSFPSGLSSVPIKLSFPDGSKRELDLVAGYFGVEQSAKDFSLSAAIGWSITERAPATPVMI